MQRAHAWVFSSLLVLACSSPANEDAGATDAGATDANARRDADDADSPRDAGPPPDGGTVDGRYSVRFVQNGPREHDYGRQLDLPREFGGGEFTMELWIRPDESFPVGPTTDDTPEQLTHWSTSDEMPYGTSEWWYSGNFLLDGHNNDGGFQNGTFSLQFYGGGRVRWHFGDGVSTTGGHWSVGVWPASDTPSLLDGAWHQLSVVRRWTGGSSAQLELWVDGAMIANETSTARTDMWTFWDGWPTFGDAQRGFFWGAEKQAAVGVLTQYEDFKGLLSEMRLWSIARSAADLTSRYDEAVDGTETGLVGWYPFDEGSGASACDVLDRRRCIEFTRPASPLWVADVPPLR